MVFCYSSLNTLGQMGGCWCNVDEEITQLTHLF